MHYRLCWNQLHPLSASRFNADHDRDTMAIYGLSQREGIEAVRQMLPSKTYFSATHETHALASTRRSVGMLIDYPSGEDYREEV